MTFLIKLVLGWFAISVVAVLLLVFWIKQVYPLEPARRQVVIEEVENGYTISECVVRTPCGITKISPNAQGAAALAWQYFTIPAPRPQWGK